MLLCYMCGYPQDSVDRSGQSAVDNPAVAASRPGRETPPRLPFGGGGCGGAKHLQKKFFKKLLN